MSHTGRFRLRRAATTASWPLGMEVEAIMFGLRVQTHVAAVESELEEVRRTVAHHVLEGVVVKAKVLVGRKRRR